MDCCNHPSFSLGTLDFHYGLRLAGDVGGTLGFLVAAVGFWIASNLRPTEPGAVLAQSAALGSGPLPGRRPGSGDKMEGWPWGYSDGAVTGVSGRVTQ